MRFGPLAGKATRVCTALSHLPRVPQPEPYPQNASESEVCVVARLHATRRAEQIWSCGGISDWCACALIRTVVRLMCLRGIFVRDCSRAAAASVSGPDELLIGNSWEEAYEIPGPNAALASHVMHSLSFSKGLRWGDCRVDGMWCTTATGASLCTCA
ncbi:hypothetical protein ERJ75_000086300 [Trypanosoma vivax]|nr:hypothetical protein ERJ75_000086300 [Trypanosoma vivax]